MNSLRLSLYIFILSGIISSSFSVFFFIYKVLSLAPPRAHRVRPSQMHAYLILDINLSFASSTTNGAREALLTVLFNSYCMQLQEKQFKE